MHLVLPAFEPSQKKDFNRVLYEGEFRDDKLNGQGKKIRHVFGRTHVYEGEFKDDKLNGQGKTNSSFGYIEEGEFIDDHLHKGKKFHHGVVIYEVENGEIKFPGKK